MTESGTRTELFAAIESLAAIIPEMRSGQLVAARGGLCDDMHGLRALETASGEELLEAVWQFRRDFQGRRWRLRADERRPALETRALWFASDQSHPRWTRATVPLGSTPGGPWLLRGSSEACVGE